ncbi:MAG TPA: DUF262 domain-containing protein [Candidatus Nanoarchaeia archaeon]|nr:DUF262 domain-containing protein [Candidatus Nanoarchaeia archaeon]
MGRTLVAHEQPISKIFSDDYIFTIPGYQRPYAWTTKEAGELFDDLHGFMRSTSERMNEVSPYFLGSIVLIKGEGSPNADVVDGQQRLTTLTILLAAIRATLSNRQAREITELLYEEGSTIQGTTDSFRLSLRERDKAFFQNYVQREVGFEQLLALHDELSDSQNNIRANATLFKERLAGMSESERIAFARFIVTRCYLVVVATPDIDSAYRIFSVLNSRGLDLSPTDILKSEIIGAIPESKRDAYTEKWEEAEEELGRERFAELFSHIRMIYRRLKPQGTLIKEFKEHVQEVDRPTVLIDAVLLPMVKAYGELVAANYESTAHAESVNEHLRWLNRLEFNDWVPPALAFSVKYRQDPAAMATFFADLERLAYSMLIQRFGINDRIERFSSLTARIAENEDLRAPGSPLQLTAEEQSSVFDALSGPVYETFSARARTSLLLRLDSLLSGGGARYDYKTITVEHVLPQTPSADSEWTKWFPDERDRLYWVHRIGNLALLTRKKNSSASNYDFDTKKTAYFSKGGISPFVLTTQVLDKTEWTAGVLKERQAQLLEICEKHWRLQSRVQASTAKVGV